MNWLAIIYVLSIAGSHNAYGREVIVTKDNRNICRLENSEDLVHCFAENGSELSTENNLVVPVLGICTFGQGNNITFRQCDENGSLLPLGKHLVRRKRTGVGFVTGLGIGSIWGPVGAGVGAAIGFVFDVVTVLCIIFCGSKESQHPPDIHCGRIEQSLPINAIKGTLNATVSWTKTTATDDEDGQINGNVRKESALVSGNSFPFGRYSVLYSVSDSTNRKDTCTINFEVKLITCLPVDRPEHGQITCDLGHIYGSKCIITCNPGYELDKSENTFVECLNNKDGSGYWSSNVPNCKAKLCKEPWPIVKRGEISCPNDFAAYSITCRVRCDSGFTVDGNVLTSCGTNGNWKEIEAFCRDTEPPLFISCPSGIQVNIDSPNNTAKVSWDLPSGADNSGNPPVIKEIHNYKPGQRFEAGTYSVQYDISDQRNNIGKSCVFKLQVNTISCEPPKLNVTGAEHMYYTCSNMYRFGAVCSLACRSGYPLGGVREIICQNDEGSDPPVLNWKWDINGLEPFCKVTPCPDLKAPGYGALVCSLWEHGNICQMQCETGYDVPIIRDGMFVCGQSTGLWRPDDNVPDCIPKKNAHQMNLLSELYYYTGQFKRKS